MTKQEYHAIIRMYPKGARRRLASKTANKMAREGFIPKGNNYAKAKIFVQIMTERSK